MSSDCSSTSADANALGDLDGLRGRLERLTEDVGHRREEAKAAREQARVAARETKERIVAEAEQIAAEATHWKSSGERMRELLEEWKAAPHAERAAEAVLWKRLSAARNAFTKRRKAYFANLEAEREDVRARKEKLCADAEELSGSTEWGPTASAFRELMRQWKEAGRADRDSEAELWKRFRAAQDKFFTARAEVFSAKDAALREHAEAKEQLLTQAQALLPVTDIRAARSALRGIQEKWEQIGAVPRDVPRAPGIRAAAGRRRAAQGGGNPVAPVEPGGAGPGRGHGGPAALDYRPARAAAGPGARPRRRHGRAHRRGSADRPPGLAHRSRAHPAQSSVARGAPSPHPPPDP